MNALQHALFRRTAWLQLVAMSLAAFLQRMPLLKLLVSGELAPGRLSPSFVLHSGLVIAASVGAMDTLVGATVVSGTPASPASATVGTSFSAAFSTTGAPAAAKSYTVSNLPPGLAVPSGVLSGTKYTINASTVSITGTPTTAGSWIVTVTAWEKADATGGSKSLSYTINVASNGTVPSITSQPASVTVTAGASVSFGVTASGTAPLTYQWQKGGVAISGATSSSYSISNTVAGDAGNYTVVVGNSAGSVTSSVATLTVNAASNAPSITGQPASVTVTAGASASFSVTATGTAPLTYQWQKGGVAISGATSSSYSISSTVAGDAGNYTVVVGNSGGSVTSSVATLTVNAAAIAPAISTQPASQTVSVGSAASFSVVATGTATLTYQWQKGGVAINGATSSSYSISSTVAGDAGNYTVVVGNSVGSVTSSVAVLTVSAAPTAAPVVTSSPASITQAAGTSVTLSCTVTGGGLSYQWSKDGVAISGATAASYTLSSLKAADAGDYTVTAVNSLGTVTSRFARLTVATAIPGRITNLSVRSVAGVGGNPLIVGFVMDGGSKSVLLRAVGPTLSLFGLTGVMADPTLVLHENVNGTDMIRASNDNWSDNGGSTTLPSVFNAVGAFGLTAGSKDAALLADVNGARTAHINSSVSGQSGVVLLEAYDTVSGVSPRFVNVSVRNYAGSGSESLIAGFVIDGNQPKRLLIRGIGPGLGLFGITGFLSDPRLDLYESVNGNNVLRASNDNWGDETGVAAAAASAGAFGLTAGSKDAAIVITLPPGAYSAIASGVSGVTGEAMVEVYELP
jgi:hypothetical protein